MRDSGSVCVRACSELGGPPPRREVGYVRARTRGAGADGVGSLSASTEAWRPLRLRVLEHGMLDCSREGEEGWRGDGRIRDSRGAMEGLQAGGSKAAARDVRMRNAPGTRVESESL